MTRFCNTLLMMSQCCFYEWSKGKFTSAWHPLEKKKTTLSNQGPVSISDKTSYRKSRCHEIGSLNYCIAFKFDRHIGSIAAEVPVKFQSDRTILNTNLGAPRLHVILRLYILSGIETGCWARELFYQVDKGWGVTKVPLLNFFVQNTSVTTETSIRSGKSWSYLTGVTTFSFIPSDSKPTSCLTP